MKYTVYLHWNIYFFFNNLQLIQLLWNMHSSAIQKIKVVKISFLILLDLEMNLNFGQKDKFFNNFSFWTHFPFYLHVFWFFFWVLLLIQSEILSFTKKLLFYIYIKCWFQLFRLEFWSRTWKRVLACESFWENIMAKIWGSRWSNFWFIFHWNLYF